MNKKELQKFERIISDFNYFLDNIIQPIFNEPINKKLLLAINSSTGNILLTGKRNSHKTTNLFIYGLWKLISSEENTIITFTSSTKQLGDTSINSLHHIINKLPTWVLNALQFKLYRNKVECLFNDSSIIHLPLGTCVRGMDLNPSYVLYDNYEFFNYKILSELELMYRSNPIILKTITG